MARTFRRPLYVWSLVIGEVIYWVITGMALRVTVRNKIQRYDLGTVKILNLPLGKEKKGEK